MSIEYEFGVFCGVFVGIFLVAILIRLMRNDRCLKGKYDERQEIVRGRAYKIGFYVLLVGITAEIFLNNFISSYISNNILNFAVLCIGVLSYACYCIWNEAYFALNDNPKKFLIISALIGIVNITSGLVAIVHEDVVLTDAFPSGITNILCGFLFIVIFINLIAKQVVKKQED